MRKVAFCGKTFKGASVRIWCVENTNVTIRPGRREDAAQAARLWMHSAQEHTSHDPIYTTAAGAEKVMRRFLADLAGSGHAFLFIAEYEGRTVGFVSGELRESSPTFRSKTWASVDDVFVEPDYRNLGVGRALVEGVKAWAKERDADGISLQVAAANDSARKFYEELGFREVSVYEVLEF
jgi:ribosomal protein S18 acetylase RimI-like enzyme